MLDARRQNLIDSLITVGFNEIEKKTHREVEIKLSKLASRNLLSSSAAISQTKELYVTGLNEMFGIVWTSLQRVISSNDKNDADSLGAYLKEVFNKYTRPKLNEFNDEIKKRFSSPALINYVPKLDDDWESLYSRYCNEIDLFVHFPDKKSADIPMNIINISNSTVGSVQTGEKAYAEIVQNINVSDKEKLIQALKEVNAYIDTGNQLVNIDKTETVFFIERINIELEKTEPNVSRISSFLLPIATGIQTVAALQGAYTVFKYVLHLLGVSIP